MMIDKWYWIVVVVVVVVVVPPALLITHVWLWFDVWGIKQKKSHTKLYETF